MIAAMDDAFGSKWICEVVKAQIPLCSSRQVSTRHDTFGLSRASRLACRAVLFDKLDTAKIHGLDASNVSCRAMTLRDEPSGIWARIRFVQLKMLILSQEKRVFFPRSIGRENGSTAKKSF